MRGLLYLLEVSRSASPIFLTFEIFECFLSLTPRTLSELASSDSFPSMSDPALPPNPSEGPPTTPTNPFAPSGSMTLGRGRGVLFGPPRPPPNPMAPSFVSAQKRQRSDPPPPRPSIKDEIVRKFPRSDYWTLRMAQAITEAGEDPTEHCTRVTPDLLVLGFLSEMQKEFTDRTDLFYTQITALNDEILGLKLLVKEAPPSSTPASKPESTSAPSQPPPPPPQAPPAGPAPPLGPGANT